MSAPFSQHDDAPELPQREPSLTIARLHRERDTLHMQAGNITRMLDARRAGDGSYTPAVCRMTLAATRNALEAYLRTLDAVEAEVMPIRALPGAKPFGRRTTLPATVSPESAA
jgi:hypothetical protein